VVFPGKPGDLWNRGQIEPIPNTLKDLLPESANPAGCLWMLEFSQASPPGTLQRVMDGRRAVAHLSVHLDQTRAPA
jgi:hypothetical protein